MPRPLADKVGLRGYQGQVHLGGPLTTAQKLSIPVALVGALVAGWIGSNLGQTAQAQEADADKPRLMCRYFQVDLASPPVIETADRTSEVGQWIGAREDEGWILYTVDFETSQKATGYPQGWLQVCLYPSY